MVAHLIAALQPSDVVQGGGNVSKLDELPPGCRAGDNAKAFVGGFRLWENERERDAATSTKTSAEEHSHARAGNKRATGLTALSAWTALERHHRDIGGTHLRAFFDDDPKRAQRMTAQAAGLFLDYSKNRVTGETLKRLLALAEQAGLRVRIDAMFRGDPINTTEKRAVLHVALRAPKAASIHVEGKNALPEVHAVLDRMTAFARRVRSGAWKGQAGKRIRAVVNIGIGGSDLGPVLAYEALKHYSDHALTFRFVSNIDGLYHLLGSVPLAQGGRPLGGSARPHRPGTDQAGARRPCGVHSQQHQGDARRRQLLSGGGGPAIP